VEGSARETLDIGADYGSSEPEYRSPDQFTGTIDVIVPTDGNN
jgi:hypothetical protein